MLTLSGCAIVSRPMAMMRFESAWSSNAIKGNNEIASEKRAVTGLKCAQC